MTTNTDITIYHKHIDQTTRLDTYTRYVVYGALWEECKAVNLANNGLADADSLRVYIPYAHMNGAEISAGDVIVRGICEKDISTDYSLAKLQKEYKSSLVTAVDKKDYGSPALWHYEIGGK